MNSARISELDIFKPNEDASKNACIGENGHHDFQTYAEGYLHAASRLIESVLDQDFDVETDVIVHPILYSVRHAIELSIKHAMEELSNAFSDVERNSGHGLLALWGKFKTASKRDRRLIRIADELDQFVMMLDEVDPDAQDFRYPINSEGSKTLVSKSIVDMEMLSQAIILLGQELKKLFQVLPIIREERSYNAFTKKLNREELRELSLELPRYDKWKEKTSINQVCDKWKLEYSISKDDFSDATDFIKKHREFSANIGIRIPLLYLSDDVALSLIKKRDAIDLRNRGQRGLPMLELICQPSPYPTVFNSLQERLSIDVIAEMTAIFYLSRDGYLSDAYEGLVEKHRTEIMAESMHSKSAIQSTFEHVFSKTTFNRHFVRGLKSLGQKRILEALPNLVASDKFRHD